MSARERWLLVGLGLLTALLFAASILLGRGWSPIWGDLQAVAALDRQLAWLILEEVRLPRAALGLMVGAVLGLTGAVLQGLLRNPLAEPGLIGASNGAALGAVVVFYFGLASAGALAVAMGGVIGAVAALALLFVLAGGLASVTTVILAGVAISAFAGAMTSFALNMAPNPYAALEIVFWMMGSLTDRSLPQLAFAAPFMLVGCMAAASTGRALDALSLGEDTAASLGFSLTALKLRAIFGAGLAVGAAVSVTGAISFVGLVVPHLIRPFVGHSPSRLLLPSALGGACLVLAADLLVRLPTAGAEPKIGVVTAGLGAPFFLYLIFKLRREAL